MREHGDLSGLILNVTTKRLVGGHQRVKILGDAPVTVERRFKKPTAQGTVAEGFVEFGGERFLYREVKWNIAKEQMAMIAANKHGGEWDDAALKELLSGLAEEKFDMSMTGFSLEELESILKEAQPPNEFPGVDENLPIEHKCPKCGYQWSGKPKAGK